MHAIVFARDRDERRRVCRALFEDTIGYDAPDEIQGFCSRLFRDPRAIGILREPSGMVARRRMQEIRLADVRSPILVLVDRQPPDDMVVDIVGCLVRGADDVQPWPIDFSEMCARLRALAVRDRGHETDTVEFSGCSYNLSTGLVTSPSGCVSLSKKEDELMRFFVRRPDAVVSKPALMEYLYQGRDEPNAKIIDVFICKLRAKLLRIAGDRDVIETVWGVGYRFTPGGVLPNLSAARQRVGA